MLNLFQHLIKNDQTLKQVQSDETKNTLVWALFLNSH